MDRYLETYREMISLRGLTSHTLKGYSPEFGNLPIQIIPAILVTAGISFVKILYFLYKLY